MTEANANMDSWDGFISGAFLKTPDVTSEQDEFVCIGADIVKDKTSEKQKIQLTLEFKGKQYKYDLNATNTKFLKSQVPTPKAVVGKKISFKKVMANNPKTKTEVESLRIAKIN